MKYKCIRNIYGSFFDLDEEDSGKIIVKAGEIWNAPDPKQMSNGISYESYQNTRILTNRNNTMIFLNNESKTKTIGFQPSEISLYFEPVTNEFETNCYKKEECK